MNKKYFIVLIMLMFTSGIRHWAADPSAILKKVEANYSGQNSPRNMEAMMIMKIQHGDNLKGYDSRVLKFVSPSDVKDIGLLILSEDLMYLYLPEFHRIRRIASSNRKDSFHGSDLSYEDLGFSDFSRDYVPKFLSEDETRWVLELNEKSDRQKAYTKIILTVDKTSLMPLSMDLYNRSGELWKHAEYSSVKLSSYTVINALKMVDKKRNSTTFLEFKDIKLDQNLDSVIFTQRFLKRRIG
jgi:outer membrane lipoprotein-sorting protein